MKSDIEIAHEANIQDVTTLLGPEYKSIIEPYGHDMGKLFLFLK